MALVYERLYQSQDLAKISLKHYVTDLVSGLVHAYSLGPRNPRTVVDVADMPVSLDLAIPCGLIINEVISNSLKYAFPGERQGTISVSIKAISGNLEMLLADDGVGLPASYDPARSTSLGMKLVYTLAGHQLGGKVELERSGGTSYKITFPLDDKA
jgi:two-component sensor histidine kinase